MDAASKDSLIRWTRGFRRVEYGLIAGSTTQSQGDQSVRTNRWMLAGLAIALVTGAVFFFAGTVSAAGNSDDLTIAAVVNQMNATNQVQLAAMEAIPPKPYTLPQPGVDVMRVQLEESYTIDGIGEDTVALTGWIAVTHGQPTTGNWNTAVTDTQFVAMNLEGNSKVFGPVRVTLDSTRPAVGKVGRITAPEKAHYALTAAKADATNSASADQADSAQDIEVLAVCRAPVAVNVSMPQLGLEMTTKDHAVWYSEVSTIPPVGHQASVTVDPIRMLSNGREVGTL
ncbi:MAG TPA: DUF6073 family protein, partial [Thermoanaerobaculia bacterium]|nr:DUF6073 family protein [Thermoanaerobaculia bacterium]